MKLHIVTIVLNGMPFLPMQLNTFNRLPYDWTWHIVEGAARNVNCTRWCKAQANGLSTDGSHEFLYSIVGHPRVHLRWGPDWKGGKVEMVNSAIEHIDHPCVLLQCDVDELWEPWQLERIVEFFDENPEINCMRFFCRYFVGLNIITTGENSYGNNPGEWLRAWRFSPGMKFRTHEPPALSGINEPVGGFERCLSREETRARSLVFDHWAYVFESQLRYKEGFYGYENGLMHWRRLQAHPGPWPVRLKDFLPWTDSKAQADLLHK